VLTPNPKEVKMKAWAWVKDSRMGVKDLRGGNCKEKA